MLFLRLLIADIDLNTGRMALLKGFIVFETVFEEVKETLSPFANFTVTLQSSKFRQRQFHNCAVTVVRNYTWL